MSETMKVLKHYGLVPSYDSTGNRDGWTLVLNDDLQAELQEKMKRGEAFKLCLVDTAGNETVLFDSSHLQN